MLEQNENEKLLEYDTLFTLKIKLHILTQNIEPKRKIALRIKSYQNIYILVA